MDSGTKKDMSEIIVVRHRDGPAADRGIDHLEARGFTLTPVRPYLGEPLPEFDHRTAGVLIEGGPQAVTDIARHPFMLDEMDYAGRAMARGLPLLCICLGAQILARHLGAAVDYHPDGHAAFGYYPLEPTEAAKDLFPAGLQYPAGNVQGFELPAGATLLAKGTLFPNQAFRMNGNTYAFQFHPEVTRPILTHWQTILADNHAKPGAQTRAEQDAALERYDGMLHEWYTGFLDGLFGIRGEDSPQRHENTKDHEGLISTER
jgi:GMP synthase (glutamine-hydrolysing)